MASVKTLKGVAHNLAHHVQSGLSWLHPRLARACRTAGLEVVSFDLIPKDPYPDGLPVLEPLALALAELREWFFVQVNLHGHTRADISRARLTFGFADDGSNCAVVATIGTSTGRAYSGSVDFIGGAVDGKSPMMRLVLAPAIDRVGVELEAGRPPSEIANALHAEGLSAIEVLMVFREATGASLADLKAFGQWWDHRGVTDREAFDAWAKTVLRKREAR
jgi:hypothetical protein